jgi:signal transduction histidine kinase
MPWVATLRALQQAAAVLAEANELSELFETVGEQVALVVPYHTLRLFLLDHEKQELYPVAIRSDVSDADLSDVNDPRFRLPLGKGVTGTIAASGRPEVVYDIEGHPAAYHIPGTPHVEESMIGVPLRYHGRVLGILTLSRLGLSQFSTEQLALLEVLGVSIAAAIEQRRALDAERRATDRELRLRELHSTFIANVSHELRTPLTTIGGFLELAVRFAADDRVSEMLDAAGRGVGRLRSLVEDLLEVVALEAGRQQLAPEPRQLRALIEEARERVGLEPDRLDLHGVGDRSIVVDPRRTVNVLAELFENAIKYGPAGGRVTVELTRTAADHIIEVTDEGPSIPEDRHDELFQRFTQLDPSATRTQGGTGIGLALARAIVQWHGGDLEYVNDAPTTTFRMTLPNRPAPRSEV